jgi:hypothetical protein
VEGLCAGAAAARLQSLSLDHCPLIGDGAVAALARAAPALTSLSLIYCMRLSVCALQALQSSICTCLRSLVLDHCDPLLADSRALPILHEMLDESAAAEQQRAALHALPFAAHARPLSRNAGSSTGSGGGDRAALFAAASALQSRAVGPFRLTRLSCLVCTHSASERRAHHLIEAECAAAVSCGAGAI